MSIEFDDIKKFVQEYDKGCDEEKKVFLKKLASSLGIESGITIKGTMIFGHRDSDLYGFGNPYTINLSGLFNSEGFAAHGVTLDDVSVDGHIATVTLTFDSPDVLATYIHLPEKGVWDHYARIMVVSTISPMYWFATVKIDHLKAAGVKWIR